MLAHEGVDGRAVADQRLERNAATADDDIGGDRQAATTTISGASRRIRLRGRSVVGEARGHARYIHEASDPTRAGLTAL